MRFPGRGAAEAAEKTMLDLAIVGGGPGGLMSAWYLKKKLGDLCRITGELLQQTRLGPPYEDVIEWFVREHRSGTPVIVYVVRPEAIAQAMQRDDGTGGEPATTFRDRQHVRIDARFYKRMRFTARDRQTREYAAFVGAFPEASAAPAGGAAQTGPAVTPNRGLDLLAVLIQPGQKKHLLPQAATRTRNDVRDNLLVRVPEVRLAVDVINGRGDVKRFAHPCER